MLIRPPESIVRMPNDAEIHALTELLVSKMTDNPSDDDRQTAEDVVKNAYIAVFDNYITDCPGYAGKLISVTYGGSECFYENFVERDGKLIKVSTEIN